MIVKPPQIVKIDYSKINVFTAGTIDQDNSEDWQTKLCEPFIDNEDIILFNPRRENWDSSWANVKSDENFYGQVNWELSYLDYVDIIVFVFLPGSKSPITLLELGLYANSGKCIVYCPDGFWRKGNVDIVCEKYGIRQVDSIEEIIKYISSYNKETKEMPKSFKLKPRSISSPGYDDEMEFKFSERIGSDVFYVTEFGWGVFVDSLTMKTIDDDSEWGNKSIL